MSTDQEVIRIGKQLEKVANADVVNEETALDLLRSLQGLPMSLDVLQKSRVGLAVNRLRKRSEETELNNVAKKLIKQWKKLLPGDKPATPKSNSKSSLSSASLDSKPPTPPPVTYSPVTSTAASKNSNKPLLTITSPVANGNDSLMSPGTPDSPIVAIFSDAFDYTQRTPSTGIDMRDKCCDLIYKAMKKGLSDLSIEDDTRLFNLSAAIEECIYNELRDTGMKYKNRVRSRVANLGDIKNPILKQRVISGAISVKKISVMPTQEMASEEMKKLRQEYTKEAIRDSQMAITEGTKTDLLKCSKCGKRNCTYNQMQTRSADEPMTTFCYCNECGNRWKFC